MSLSPRKSSGSGHGSRSIHPAGNRRGALDLATAFQRRDGHRQPVHYNDPTSAGSSAHRETFRTRAMRPLEQESLRLLVAESSALEQRGHGHVHAATAGVLEAGSGPVPAFFQPMLATASPCAVEQAAHHCRQVPQKVWLVIRRRVCRLVEQSVGSLSSAWSPPSRTKAGLPSSAARPASARATRRNSAGVSARCWSVTAK